MSTQKYSRRQLALIATSGLAAAALGAAVSTPANADPQPLMSEALNDLQNARDALENAASNKGGHRVRAIRYVDQAIREVRLGIAYANGN